MEKWEQMRTAMGGMAKGRRDARQAWQELEGLLQQTLADVKQMDLTEVDIHFSTHKSTAWGQLFNVHKNVRQPEVSHLQKEAQEIVKDMGISLASYSLVLITSGADNATAWIQGLKGHESGPFMVAKVWETAVDEVREKYMVNPSKPNLLLISSWKESCAMMGPFCAQRNGRLLGESTHRVTFCMPRRAWWSVQCPTLSIPWILAANIAGNGQVWTNRPGSGHIAPAVTSWTERTRWPTLRAHLLRVSMRKRTPVTSAGKKLRMGQTMDDHPECY
jgi:hypothetical protein